jgi:hypothetical protein
MAKFMNGDSSTQQEIEKYLFNKLPEELGVKFEHNPTIYLNEEKTVYIEPDFYSKEERKVGEIHTHKGRLKPAQRHKVAGDILKMLLLDKVHGTKYKKYIVVCSDEEEKQLKGSSHLAFTLKTFEIEVKKITLSEELDKSLRRL